MGFSISHAQLKFGGNFEAGGYKSISNFLSNGNDLLYAVEANLGYKYQKENTEASLNLKVRPEWFGLKRELFSFKFRGVGEFVRHEDNFDWGINVSRQFNNLSGDGIDLDYDIFSIQGNSTFYFWEGFPLSAALGYSYQNISRPSNQSHDIVFIETKLHDIVSPSFRTSYSLYAEKFTIEGEIVENGIKKNETNPGFRIGPGIGLNYLKDFVIDWQYRFLLHFSGYSEFPSFEHRVRLVAGKILSADFSAFFLVDYYWRSIKNTGGAENVNVLYSPFNRENNISLKLSYDLSEIAELYVKGGYFRNDLVYNNYIFEGWDLLLGFGLSR